MRSGRREAWWEYARSSLWVLPGASLIAALVLGALLSRVQVSTHSSLHHLLFQGTEDDARNLLIGIMGAVITIIALVLGLTLVALQLSSTQYSPRVLRNFLRDRSNQVFLSVIVATFAYSAGGLYTVVASPSGPATPYPQLAVTVAIVLLFASLAALIFFLDHLAHSIQIDRLMGGIEHATIQVIKQEPPGVGPRSGPGPAPAPPVWAVMIPPPPAWLRADRPSRTAAPAGRATRGDRADRSPGGRARRGRAPDRVRVAYLPRAAAARPGRTGGPHPGRRRDRLPADAAARRPVRHAAARRHRAARAFPCG